LRQSSDLRLLAVLAHPDDESFGPGGTLALYAHRGVEVHLACATRGEVGEVSPELLQDYESIAKLREDELRCAATHLGIKDVHFLGYRDSGMEGSPDNEHPDALAAAPLNEVAARITLLVRQIRPQVIITFDPYGGYGHPDHIAIQRATTDAFHAASNPDQYPDGMPPYEPQKLYYHTFPRRMMRLLARIMPLLGQDPRRWGRNKDIDLLAIASHAFPIDAQINIGEVSEAKRKASACHSSQTGPPARGLLGWIVRRLGEYETFMRFYPVLNNRRREKDLFEGVTVTPGG
jgi:LmbE family N-acetylglucosaminyl deacetylase